LDKVLELKSVVAGYGDKTILQGVNLDVRESELVGLVGPNGSGKSTVLKSIFGMVKVSDGEIWFKGKDIKNRKPRENTEDSICYIPQGNNVFDKLTVDENLQMGGILLRDRRELNRRIDSLYEKFPKLKNYKNTPCGRLSGGERQMVGICRGLVMNPSFILIDEPSIGLSPILVKQTIELIRRLREEFKVTVLIVEQNVPALITIVDRVWLLKTGKVVHEERVIDENTMDRLSELFLK